MKDTEVLRHRIAALLKETEALPSLESFFAMEAAEGADTMTASWDLCHRWHDLSRELESEAEYGAAPSP